MEASDQPTGQEPSQEPQEEGVAAHDPSQDNPAELTEEQRKQAEANSVQGEQGDWVQEQVAGPPPGIGQDTPVATSAPDPARQSGVPLPQDRAEGVRPGPGARPPATPTE